MARGRNLDRASEQDAEERRLPVIVANLGATNSFIETSPTGLSRLGPRLGHSSFAAATKSILTFIFEQFSNETRPTTDVMPQQVNRGGGKMAGLELDNIPAPAAALVPTQQPLSSFKSLEKLTDFLCFCNFLRLAARGKILRKRTEAPLPESRVAVHRANKEQEVTLNGNECRGNARQLNPHILDSRLAGHTWLGLTAILESEGKTIDHLVQL
ncbi:hypothetical protein J6590_064550 [Homalodisca vitripennis]|nr:hypothetical protein J6590_064550 [Homalodisca vitripennis]